MPGTVSTIEWQQVVRSPPPSALAPGIALSNPSVDSSLKEGELVYLYFLNYTGMLPIYINMGSKTGLI
jgi:hypothetical protein